MAPSTWARTVLGLQPLLVDLWPKLLTAGMGDLVMQVTGEHIHPAAQVLWNGTPLAPAGSMAVAAESPEAAAERMLTEQAVTAGLAPVTADGLFAVQATNTISVQVPAALVAAAGFATIQVQNPGDIKSPPVQLAINHTTPVATTLAPTARKAGTPGFTLTVNGSSFAGGATVIWDGVALPTTFVNSTQVTAQVPAGLLAVGNLDGAAVLVRNPAPVQADSNALPFVLQPEVNGRIYLPTVQR
jgi:hypothetical protein